MWNELLSMLIASSLIAMSILKPKNLSLFCILTLLIPSILRTPGIGLLALLGSFSLFLVLGEPSKRYPIKASSILLFFIFLMFAGSFRSGWGRFLGFSEAVWMAWTSNWVGVGWGNWVWNQAQAQRAVLEIVPVEIWKDIAPFFQVAPSLPAHLLAELGWLGLFFWLLGLSLTFVTAIRVRWVYLRGTFVFFFVFVLTSSGTTPIQYLLTVDPRSVVLCDEALKKNQTNPQNVEFFSLCPEIKRLEWQGYALESLGRKEKAFEAYRLWHETFPKDVMPSYALARLSVELGERGWRVQSLDWFEKASKGNSKNDRKAEALRLYAIQILKGDDLRFKLWEAMYN